MVKTGMGSSAAMTTALVASLLHYFGIVRLPTAEGSGSAVSANVSDSRDKAILHNLAQLAHAIAQGKLGSGFDVAAAVYGKIIHHYQYAIILSVCFYLFVIAGSQLYQRFAAEPFAACMEPSANAKAIFAAVIGMSAWTQVIRPLALPPSIQLMMGDTCGGSSSVSMAREVLRWRKEKPVEASEIWNQLLSTNSQIAQNLVKLSEHIKALTPHSLAALQTRLNEGIDWTATSGNIVVEECRIVRNLFKTARSLLKRMGEGAGVGIEPDEQTRLADATEAIPGVLCAGVPGAGGVDAIFCLVLTPTARDRVEQLWSTWCTASGTSAVVCPLMLQTDSGSAVLGTVVDPSIKWE